MRAQVIGSPSAVARTSTPTVARSPVPGDLLLHPLCLVSLLAWGLNDHFLKAAVPGWWTGKLSDVAGLIAFPLLLISAMEMLEGARHFFSKGTYEAGPLPRHLVAAAVLATALVFSLINAWVPAAEIYRKLVGGILTSLLVGKWQPLNGYVVRHTLDATDLLALPALILPWKVQCQARGIRHRRVESRGPS